MPDLIAVKRICRRAALGAVATCAIAWSGQAVAAPQPQFFPFFLPPPLLAAPPM